MLVIKLFTFNKVYIIYIFHILYETLYIAKLNKKLPKKYLINKSTLSVLSSLQSNNNFFICLFGIDRRFHEINNAGEHIVSNNHLAFSVVSQTSSSWGLSECYSVFMVAYLYNCNNTNSFFMICYYKSKCRNKLINVFLLWF